MCVCVCVCVCVHVSVCVERKEIKLKEQLPCHYKFISTCSFPLHQMAYRFFFWFFFGGETKEYLHIFKQKRESRKSIKQKQRKQNLRKRIKRLK